MTEFGDAYGRVGRRTEGIEGDGNLIGRPKVSTNPDTWEHPETKPPTKEYTWSMALCTYVAEDCLVWPQWERICLIL